MTERLAEERLVIQSTNCGTFWINSVMSARSLAPSLRISGSCDLNPIPESPGVEKQESLRDFYVADISGVIRSRGSTETLGNLIWSGRRQELFATKGDREWRFKLDAELDRQRLERFEEERGSDTPQFEVDLWPRVIAQGRPVLAEIPTFRFRVNRDDWGRVLKRSGFGMLDIVEIPLDHDWSSQFKKSAQLTQKARGLIIDGQYKQAIVTCRNAIHAVTNQLSDNYDYEFAKGNDETVLKRLISTATNERHADDYFKTISGLKSLSGAPGHPSGVLRNYSRQEALFLVRAMEACLGVLGSFARQVDADDLRESDSLSS